MSAALCARASSGTSLATSPHQRPSGGVPAMLAGPSSQEQTQARTPQEYLKAIAPEVRLPDVVRGHGTKRA